MIAASGSSGTNVVLRPRAALRYVAQGAAVLTTDLDGFVTADEHGFYVHETRLLSRWRVLVDGVPPVTVAISNVEQHSSLGYYLIRRADQEGLPRAEIAQQAIELRVTRFVGGGLHEDLDLTNFTAEVRRLRLEIEVDADFTDQGEVGGPRRQPSPWSLTATFAERIGDLLGSLLPGR